MVKIKKIRMALATAAAAVLISVGGAATPAFAAGQTIEGYKSCPSGQRVYVSITSDVPNGLTEIRFYSGANKSGFYKGGTGGQNYGLNSGRQATYFTVFAERIRSYSAFCTGATR